MNPQLFAVMKSAGGENRETGKEMLELFGFRMNSIINFNGKFPLVANQVASYRIVLFHKATWSGPSIWRRSSCGSGHRYIRWTAAAPRRPIQQESPGIYRVPSTLLHGSNIDIPPGKSHKSRRRIKMTQSGSVRKLPKEGRDFRKTARD